MLIINIPKNYDTYFKEAVDLDKDSIEISYSKNFSGGAETAEIVIALSPIIIPAVIAALKATLKHIQEMKRISKTNPDEIIVKVKRSNIDIEVAIKSSNITPETNIDELVESVIDKAISKENE